MAMPELGPVKARKKTTGGLTLSVALTPNLRTRPVLDGIVAADGLDVTPLELHPSELFWRQLKFAEFDVSEMSMSSLLMAVARGDDLGLSGFRSLRRVSSFRPGSSFARAQAFTSLGT